MANTVQTTNRTIEISDIDEDYMMPSNLNVQSVVFIPAGQSDSVDIVENSEYDTDPVKVRLLCGDSEPRGWILNQRLRLGFVFADGTFTEGCKVIFNIGELKGD